MSPRIKMHDWEVWQTYRKDRGTPPWVKVHRSILSSSKWAALSDAEKGQLISMWVVAADADGCLPSDPKTLRKICQLDADPDVNKFIELGWVDYVGCRLDAKLTPSSQPNDAPETETETETKRKEAEKVLKAPSIKSYPQTPEGMKKFMADYEAFAAKHMGPQAAASIASSVPSLEDVEAKRYGLGSRRAA